jgi:hypothetical protein
MSEIRELETAIARRVSRTSAAAVFRATVDQRLLNLESQLNDLKTRLNGLLFFMATTVFAQVLLRLLA